MRHDYRGYEVNVERQKSLGGDSMIYFQIVRESDGWFAEDNFMYGDGVTVQEVMNDMKARIDAELLEDDPWMEHTDEAYV